VYFERKPKFTQKTRNITSYGLLNREMLNGHEMFKVGLLEFDSIAIAACVSLTKNTEVSQIS
jgi:hypothetical protein